MACPPIISEDLCQASGPTAESRRRLAPAIATEHGGLPGFPPRSTRAGVSAAGRWAINWALFPPWPRPEGCRGGQRQVRPSPRACVRSSVASSDRLKKGLLSPARHARRGERSPRAGRSCPGSRSRPFLIAPRWAVADQNEGPSSARGSRIAPRQFLVADQRRVIRGRCRRINRPGLVLLGRSGGAGQGGEKMGHQHVRTPARVPRCACSARREAPRNGGGRG